jgi:hypothetical protein
LLRNCLLKHVFAGMIERTGRRGRRHKQLPKDFKEKRRYWNLKRKHQLAPAGEMALDDALYL